MAPAAADSTSVLQPVDVRQGRAGAADPEKRGELVQLLLGAPRHSKGTSAVGRGGRRGALSTETRLQQPGENEGRQRSQAVEEAECQALLQGGREPS